MPGKFEYLQCAGCGTLSIANVPEDLAQYYPGQKYHSFSQKKTVEPSTFRRKLAQTYAWLLLIRSLDLRFIRRICPDRASRILDVGSGDGAKLEELRSAGYMKLTGIDPFLPAAMERDEPFPLRRCGIAEAEGGWDLIMYHHVMEHVSDPLTEFKNAAAKLAPSGKLLVRVPVADSWAFKRYGKNWVQLDCPRHLWIPTRAALATLAARAGLVVTLETGDSTAFQFWASRHYARTRQHLAGAAAWAPPGVRKLKYIPSLVLETLFAGFLNRLHRGDQACFVLQKADPA